VRIVLASGSATRCKLLENAGVPCECVVPQIDEQPIKADLRTRGADNLQIVEFLAEQKALAVARGLTGALVIGADQVLDFNGAAFDKPKDRDDALAQLKALRGHEHTLLTACAVAEGHGIVWRRTDRTTLKMRAASDAYLECYVDTLGERALAGPGAYQLEGLGAQLFERVDGDFFAVLGLPLLPLLAYLRERGALPA
jgi:septum formation protein